MTKKAIILLSGGLDSVTVLAMAKQQGYSIYALSFDYGQKHNAELASAQRIAQHYQVLEHKVITLGLGSISGSALTDAALTVPITPQEGIPVTYVPARNTIFLSFALGWAEVIDAHDIFIGVNAVDYSGYPDCRPKFIEAFQALANLATKAGVEGHEIKVHAPLINMSKGDIIQQGTQLGVDYAKTVSCYASSPEGFACGKCDACRLRKIGFEQAGIADPTPYIKA
ncbi:7-cyano-7-deazaguanine synthase QueC [methanotrophic endosymbiont of Bathymodiolus puteoserpentis (Logatchev)]|jgi:7-cyano-7-deazaguanine synthase|uniref:7-cyano-7-deazaguanine synthase QueC n=1 Tax=methanotrophic endosymbiont of Bathymodiolus puteoserpentis (Logatchev) TaxID=343235 RepID=UPI0013C5B580|nr:7-cyano-7-deazaguanine synthase QueC [methanotrophic endosymbiont of Bathymodiolus puteoserpentis (Logatchev)]SHE19221.1 Queuosine Biosynthesis QueC ATPase [methanotrophic endosymbiont of Bathymodiolus puteoserpentis (Logatchev)]